MIIDFASSTAAASLAASSVPSGHAMTCRFTSASRAMHRDLDRHSVGHGGVNAIDRDAEAGAGQGRDAGRP